MSDNAKLFQVKFKVRPTVEHPLYWDMEFGVFIVWCFAVSGEIAKARVDLIMGQLPFEVIAENSNPAVSDQATEDTENKRLKVLEARAIGIAFLLIAAETGTSEADLLDNV